MKKVCITGLIILMLISFCFADIFEFGSFWTNIRTVQQKYDTWCVFTALEIMTGQEQFTFVQKYVGWKGSGDYTEGVRYTDLIPFWNFATGEKWSRLVNSATVFNRTSHGYWVMGRDDIVLPRLGIIPQNEAQTVLHAVVVYYVEVKYEHPRVNDYSVAHTVWFSDPWTGSRDHLVRECRSNANPGNGLGPMYVVY